MRKIVSLVFIFFFSFLYSQSFSWAKQIGDYDDQEDRLWKMTLDDDENVFFVGTSNSYGGCDVDPSTNKVLIKSNFLVKLDKDGNYVWSKQLANTDFGNFAELKIDQNKLYVIYSAANFVSTNTLSDFTFIDIFDKNTGTLISHKRLYSSSPKSFILDNNGNFYISGMLVPSGVKFDSPNESHNFSSSFLGSYLIAFDSNGNVKWKKIYDNFFSNSKLKLTSDNNVIFGANVTGLSGIGYKLEKLNSQNGNVIWSDTFDDQYLEDFNIGTNGNIVLAGHWSNQFAPIDVDPSPTNQYNFTSNTYWSNYVLCLDSNGNFLTAKPYYNNGSYNIPFQIYNVYADEYDNYYFNGRFQKNFDADPGTGVSILRYGDSDTAEAMSIRFDNTFSYKKSYRLGEVKNHSKNGYLTEILDMIVKDKNQYVLGNFMWHTDFDISDTGEFVMNSLKSSVINWDGFIVKMSDCITNPHINVLNANICIGKDIELSASGGTSYLWSGPNGFSSKLQNPKVLNATSLNSGIYSCKISGSGDCDGTFNINVFVGDNLKPIPDITTLPKITGDCTILITTIPTATDNCKGKIIASTTDPLSYSLPGNYTITWNYDDGNGNIATQTQLVEITAQPLPIANASQTFCKIDNKKILDIIITATNPKWYDASGNNISSSTPLTDNTKYYVTQNSSGCESARKEILVTLSDPNPPAGNATQSFCSASNPTLKDVMVTGTAIKWFDNLGNLLPETTSLTNSETYFATQTVNNCESTQKLAIKINIATNYLSANDFATSLCNDTTASTKKENLDQYKKELILNPTDYTFQITDSNGKIVTGDADLEIGTNIFDVKITSALGCYQIVKLSLTLNEKPKINLPIEKEFCDSDGTPLDAGFVKDYIYLWNTGETSHEIKADKEQTYTVKVTTPAGCTNIANVIVKKSKQAEIKNIIINNSEATVVMSIAGEYLFSLDQSNWQTSNKFSNLKNGAYTVFVKTNLGCDLGFKSFTIFSLSNIFTPNNDGVNDTWKIPGIENYPNSEIRIIDKNGTVVVEQITKGEAYEWNGESNGRKLPTDSYWYQIRVSDGRILEGYVVIKNRN